MSKKNKKRRKKFNSQKASESIRRKQELEQYGKLLSLRPSITHKDKTKYTRKQKHKNNIDEDI